MTPTKSQLINAHVAAHVSTMNYSVHTTSWLGDSQIDKLL